jgi:CheY-like chemotaxis protein
MHLDVLVVDDDAATRESIAMTLEDAGYAVKTTRDGSEAFRILHKAQPKVVLLDLMMPVMNGWGLLVAIRANPVLKDLPVVTMSAHEIGKTDSGPFLRKPFDQERLLSMLMPYLRSRRLRETHE